ncbi:hypothetical protein [Catellatospora citrea]|uniref:Mce-associated membrane protein n=1 Tax=Catellatospora citrea TaxID=53366 RepID=A0A8J3KJ22_9ACTN|nr:hypothetical protein [Catellatospora citrea]RKE12356.1 hypothetical protein C8E86_7297 [Catellatospora citrea]GIG00868.1 hypothetical protein Cci01nite_59610 [Catellatospora citrea]
MSRVEEIARRRRRMWARIVLVPAVVVALVVFLGWPLLAQYQNRQEAQADQAALPEYAAVVRPAVRALMAYDYRDFDGAVARGQSFLTGDFAAEYARTMASLRPTVLAEQTVVTVADPSVGIRQRGRQRAELKAYVTQRRTSNRLAGVEITHSEVRITLERVGSGWKVARFVVTPNSTAVSPTAVP